MCETIRDVWKDVLPHCVLCTIVQYSFISSSVSVFSDLTRNSSFNRTSTRISLK